MAEAMGAALADDLDISDSDDEDGGGGANEQASAVHETKYCSADRETHWFNHGSIQPLDALIITGTLCTCQVRPQKVTNFPPPQDIDDKTVVAPAAPPLVPEPPPPDEDGIWF